jgi:m7GpppX diphosphatase
MFTYIDESYADYLNFITNHNFADEKWIYDILDGITEQKNVLYKDDDMMIIISIDHKPYCNEKFHLLTIPTDKTIRSIRDLTGDHISLLEKMKSKTIEYVKKTYHTDRHHLKMYFHYAPSTYQLHIHTQHIQNIYSGSSIEYSHELNSVINILSYIPDYYQRISMIKRIKS